MAQSRLHTMKAELIVRQRVRSTARPTVYYNIGTIAKHSINCFVLKPPQVCNYLHLYNLSSKTAHLRIDLIQRDVMPIDTKWRQRLNTVQHTKKEKKEMVTTPRNHRLGRLTDIAFPTWI